MVDMSYMFENCKGLHKIRDLSSFDFNSFINKSNMLTIWGNLNKIPEYEILSSAHSNYDLSFKILLVGGPSIGKSLLIYFGIRNIFDMSSYTPKVGFEFVTFVVRFKDKIIKLQIFDTSCQEKYRSFITSFYSQASLVVILYAINNKDDFNSLNSWVKDCKEKCAPNTKLFLVGNKIGCDEKE